MSSQRALPHSVGGCPERMAAGDSYDALILGGGTAGCVLAARLSEDPERSVCLVEAGPDYGPFDGGGWPGELVDPRGVATSHDWEAGAELSLARAKVLGGCSVHNAALVAWGHPDDYDEWVPAGLGFRAMEAWLRRAEAEIASRPLERAEMGPWARAVIAGAEAAGVPALDDFNEPRDGVAALPVNVHRSARWSTPFAYLDGARARENLTVLDRSLVDRILVDSRRAVGAVAVRDGRPTELVGALVIVSAGVFGSPLILLRSGIGPAGHLDELDIEATVELPGVGANLQDHFGAVVMFRPTDELVGELDAQAASGCMIASGSIVKGRSSCCPPGTWDLHLISWSAKDTEGVTGKDWRVQLTPYVMKPRSIGAVRLRDTNPESHPDVELGYLSDRDGRDLLVLSDGIDLTRRIAATEPIARLIEGEVVPGADVSETEAFMRENVRGYFHPVGTCAIGAAPEAGAVVDRDCRVLGLDNVYVCDASIMPTIPRANTHLTTIAIAERTAARLMEESE
jgi:choline dehydrogenase